MKEHLTKAQPVRHAYGTGKFWRKKVPKPAPLKQIPRSYSRYGISRGAFLNELKKVRNPAAILVTSMMTYWYPGVQEVITLSREVYPEVPVILGGPYARLCEQHALLTSGADRVISESGLQAMAGIINLLKGYGIEAEKGPPSLDTLPYPAFDMLHTIEYISILTSLGCPYRCQYCASHFINPQFFRRDPHHVLEEILYWYKNYRVQDFAFYDDALLVDSDAHTGILLEEITRRKLDLRFHTPNALHVREITSEMAELLYRAGFRTIRLGLETSDMAMHRDLDRKISEGEFERAVMNLRTAGFTKKEVGAYVLVGLPRQSVNSVLRTIDFVGDIGASPYLAEYSPIPHTALWQEALVHSDYDLSSEPLFHNNTLLPCWDQGQRTHFPELKQRVQEIRKG
jgi:radical SAM superfamily enzyme YgiQ (UPF0313 family)